MRIGDALVGQIAGGRADIADRLAPILEPVFAHPLVAIARGAAIIGLDDRIAPRGQELRKPVETPIVARAGPAMRQNDRWQVLRALPTGSVK